MEPKFKKGDRIRVRSDVNLMKGSWLKAGEEFTVGGTERSVASLNAAYLGRRLPPEEGRDFVVRFHKPGTPDTVVQEIYEFYFELVQPRSRVEEVRALGKANMRKRAHIRLLEKQLDEARTKVSEYNKRLYDVARERNQLKRENAARLELRQRLLNALFQSGPFNDALPVEPNVSVNTPGPFAHTVSKLDGIASSVQDIYAGHAAQGGLQKHSIGDEYPYIVQGYQEDPTSEVVWQIKDAETGFVLHSNYETAADAERVAASFKRIDERDARSGDKRSKIQPDGYFN